MKSVSTRWETGVFLKEVLSKFRDQIVCIRILGSLRWVSLLLKLSCVQAWIVWQKYNFIFISWNHVIKIHCNRYIHPGTDGRGSFIKKIYTGSIIMIDCSTCILGVSNQGVPSTHGVIVYEWEGTPHPVSVDLSTLPNPHIMKERAFGSRSWEVESLSCQFNVLIEGAEARFN